MERHKVEWVLFRLRCNSLENRGDLKLFPNESLDPERSLELTKRAACTVNRAEQLDHTQARFPQILEYSFPMKDLSTEIRDYPGDIVTNW